MNCDNCFESQCELASDNTTNPVTLIDYRKELVSTFVCGDNLVEGDKGEVCDGAFEGCNNHNCTSNDVFICYSPILGNSRCIPC
jgi:hypothetical protein